MRLAQETKRLEQRSGSTSAAGYCEHVSCSVDFFGKEITK